MRKSERVTRKPEFLTFADNRREKVSSKIAKEEEDDAEDENNSSDSQSENSIPLVQSTKNTTTKRQPGVKGASKRVAFEAKSPATLFELILHGRTEWHTIFPIELFQSDRVRAINELVNLCLQSAGAKGNWIAGDIDLEPLGPEEIDQLLEDRIQEWLHQSSSRSYPLIEKSKVRQEPFLIRYRHFRTSISEEILSLNKKSTSYGGLELLRVILDILTSFSSLSIASVRDSVTEAILSITSSLIENALQAKESLRLLERQLTGATDGRDNTKTKALEKQLQSVKKELKKLSEIIDGIFNAVFMHRSRDANEEIRAHCIQHITRFISFHPDQVLRQEYLKYLGWACNDFSAHVRISAIKQIRILAENDDYLQHFEAFVSHFMNRFIQIATSDVDENVCLEMIGVMRIFQKQGFLDAISEEKLDEVDAIVFDSEIDVTLRAEALLFLMDHTEGFSEEYESNNTTLKPSGKGRKVSSQNDAARDLKRKHNALQLETLTEFAEHHLKEKVEFCALLAEAILHTPKASLLFDWETIILLLMRETDEMISQQLRPSQISILLTMFITTAKYLHSCVSSDEKAQSSKSNALFDVSQFNEGNISSIFSKGFKLPPVTGRGADNDYEEYERFNEIMLRKLPTLLKRFKDNIEHLRLLSEVLLCLTLPTQKHFQDFQALFEDFFLQQNDIHLLRNIIIGLKSFSLKRVAVADCTKRFIEKTALISWNSYLQAEKNLQNVLRINQQNTSNRRSRDFQEAKKDLRTTILQLMNCVRKIRILVELLSTVEFNIVKSDQLFIVIRSIENLKELIDLQLIDPLLEEGTGSDNFSLKDFRTFMEDNLQLLLYPILWDFRELIRLGQLQQQQNSTDSLEIDQKGATTNESLQALANTILNHRNNLLDHLALIMRMEVEELSRKVSAKRYAQTQIIRLWKIEAFRCLSSIRSFFPQQFSSFAVVDILAFQPNEEILQLQRNIFESEEAHIREFFQSTNGSHQSTQIDSQLVTTFTQELLLPLSQSLFVDFDHINRRQAAAILQYYNIYDDFGDSISTEESWCVPQIALQSIVRYFAKKLKEFNIITFAEVQLATLKLFFHDEIFTFSIQKEVGDEESEKRHVQMDEDNKLSSEEIEEHERIGYERLISLSKKFAGTFSAVGKAKSQTNSQQSTITAIVALLKAGIDYLFTNETETDTQIGFAAALIPYLRLLSQPQFEYLNNYLESILTRRMKENSLLKELLEQEGTNLVTSFKHFQDFQEILENGASGVNGKLNLSVSRKYSSKRQRKTAPKTNNIKDGTKVTSKGKRNTSRDDDVSDSSLQKNGLIEEFNDAEDEEDEKFVASLRKEKSKMTDSGSRFKNSSKSKISELSKSQESIASRRSQRTSGQQKVNYYENEDSDAEDEDEDKEIIIPQKRRGQNSALSVSQQSNISILSSDKDSQSQRMSGKKRSSSTQSSPPALNLDLEDNKNGNGSEGEGSPTVENSLQDRKKAKFEASRRSSKKLIGDEEVDDLDALPSRRKLI